MRVQSIAVERSCLVGPNQRSATCGAPVICKLRCVVINRLRCGVIGLKLLGSHVRPERETKLATHYLSIKGEVLWSCHAIRSTRTGAADTPPAAVVKNFNPPKVHIVTRRRRNGGAIQGHQPDITLYWCRVADIVAACMYMETTSNT